MLDVLTAELVGRCFPTERMAREDAARILRRLVHDDEATVERMAKALWRGAELPGVTWGDLPKGVADYWRHQARVALTAAVWGDD